ncbi:MAG: CoA-transferase subunit beta [Solirubrobacterales bacterium]
MKEIAPANPLEMLAYVISLQIENNKVVYIGTGLPMVGAALAAKTHAPHITQVFESGAQDPLHGDMPWSVCDPFTWRKSPMIQEMAYSFGQVYNGYVDIAFLGGAQVDPYGNVNTTVIGDYHKPKARLTGSGGNNDLASLSDSLCLVGIQTADKFPAKCDYVTSVGWLEGGDSRRKAGLIGNGPKAVITQLGVYDFHPESRRMRIKSLHPGITFEIAQACTGFELLKPNGSEIPVTPTPPPEVLEILRTEVDPRGVFTKLPTA